MKERAPKELVRGPNGKMVEGKAPAPVNPPPKKDTLWDAITRPTYTGPDGARRNAEALKRRGK